MSKTPWLAQYEPFIQAVVQLFHPFVEAAVHDLKEGKIIALYHNISRRKIGDPSPLHELKVSSEKFPDYFVPYYKQNWDGRMLKCTSITIRDDKGKPVGLICLNADTSLLQQTQDLLSAFLKIQEGAENPIETFGASFESQIHALVGDYLTEKAQTLSSLSGKDKKDLIGYLYQKGAFNYKNAIPFVANYLNLSRATIYNHLKK